MIERDKKNWMYEKWLEECKFKVVINEIDGKYIDNIVWFLIIEFWVVVIES